MSRRAYAVINVYVDPGGKKFLADYFKGSFLKIKGKLSQKDNEHENGKANDEFAGTKAAELNVS
jgi:hypothetical protein